jgi:predicted DNA-binding protein (MmcQ/YjbR family)
MPRQATDARKPARKTPRPPAREPKKAPAPAGIRTAPKGHRFHTPEHAIRRYALGLPHSYEDFPWGHRAFRVSKKVFLFLACDDGVFTFTAKLPHSQILALSLPFTEPTGYGMGRSGWVTARFSGRAAVPVGVLCRWIDESYRAVAPKKVAAMLDDRSRPVPRRPPGQR